LLQNLFLRGVSFLKRPSLCLLILICLTSCAVTPNLEESISSHLIGNVPFFPQEAFQCGPASLAGVLNYWGVNVSPEEIAMEIYSPSAGGTLNLDMIFYTEKKGMKAILYKGSIDDIKNKIDTGFPVIVLVDLGLWIYQQNHFMVVVGYNENGIVANSGKDRLKPIAKKNFIKTWERTNFWTLLITSQ
jgi:ABC-type bacteriocin/lantibiotic exporter with double-glycine peptidase domain